MLEILGLSILLALILFLTLAPQLGGKESKKDKEKFKELENYSKGRFKNNEKMSVVSEMKFETIVNMFRDGETIPKIKVPVEKIDLKVEGKTKVVWCGHSTIFIEIDKKIILLDPMLSNRPSPVPLFIKKRFNEEIPVDIEALEKIDGVVISHDHYDHLDYKTIKKIKDKVNMFFVPLGVKAHLKRWGVSENKITELNWNEESHLGDIRLISVPSQHFSGRGPFDRDKTLWCSWIIQGSSEKLFFSGDTGYHKGFKTIGEKYGPFDLTMMECGQYNEGWVSIHMLPEQTVKAHKDLRGKVLMPIHWGAFKLSTHPWNEPPQRAINEANKDEIKIVIPKIGEKLVISNKTEVSYWWKNN